MKIAFVALEISLGCAFVVCFARYDNAAAVLEWLLALSFVLYAAAFLVDLLPAIDRDQEVEEEHRREHEMDMGTEALHHREKKVEVGA